MKTNYWIKALRIPTLLLSFTSVGMGNILAIYDGYFNSDIFFLSLITALLLQIISNFANDYGDAIKKTDKIRIGPERMVQKGYISLSQIKFAIRMLVVLAVFFGLILLYVVFRYSLMYFIFFSCLGGISLSAAIAYTVGKKPYGYRGLGDIAVFFFFGIIGVMGSFFLQTKMINIKNILPSICCGCFTTAVLNINNIRDYVFDKRYSKITIPVYLGIQKAKIYHALLLLVSYFCNLLFFILQGILFYHYIYFLFLLILCILNAYEVQKKEGRELNSVLKQMVILCFLWMVTFAITLFYNKVL